MKFDLISVDMFQTLVDINTRVSFIWKRILTDKYTDEMQTKCVNLLNQKAIHNFHNLVTSKDHFCNIRTLFHPYFEEIAAETELHFNADKAADIFVIEHGFSELYYDTTEFFDIINKRIPICLVSDADTSMLNALISKFSFSNVFISEQVRAYKNDPESRIFKRVLEYYRVKPDRILHIGDSLSDIAGASRIGIKTCWINRNNYEWKHSVKPDYIISSLAEIADILEDNNKHNLQIGEKHEYL